MVKVNYKDLQKITKFTKELDPKIKKSLYRATNKGLSKCRTEIGREIRGVYTKIKLSDVRKSVTIKKAGMQNLVGEVKVRNSMTPIQDALLRTKKRTKKGIIKVNIKDNKVRKLSMSGKYKPFIVKLKTGKVIVAKRTSKDPYPIKQIKTVSIPQMAANIKVSDKVIDKTNKIIEKEFDRLMQLDIK